MSKYSACDSFHSARAPPEHACGHMILGLDLLELRAAVLYVSLVLGILLDFFDSQWLHFFPLFKRFAGHITINCGDCAQQLLQLVAVICQFDSFQKSRCTLSFVALFEGDIA